MLPYFHPSLVKQQRPRQSIAMWKESRHPSCAMTAVLSSYKCCHARNSQYCPAQGANRARNRTGMHPEPVLFVQVKALSTYCCVKCCVTVLQRHDWQNKAWGDTSMSKLAFSRLLARVAVSSLAACRASLCTSSSARSLVASLPCSGEAGAADLSAALRDASWSLSCLHRGTCYKAGQGEGGNMCKLNKHTVTALDGCRLVADVLMMALLYCSKAVVTPCTVGWLSKLSMSMWQHVMQRPQCIRHWLERALSA